MAANLEESSAALVLREVIGEGGSGTVYAASRDGRELAVKVLREDVARSPRERRRFVDEAERMRRVAHPGLVPLLESGVMPDGRPYLAMPRLHGETLARRLQRGALPLAEALSMFEALAGAVDALHLAGLVHRDIKPENIFLEVDRHALERAETGLVAIVRGDRADGFTRPVLLDLGIAQDAAGGASTTTLQGQTRGTPAYMAPERFFGAAATTRSDVYELAVTLYAMLVGSLPWRDSQGAERLAPIDPTERGVVLPEGLRRVLLTALATRPEARPQGVRAFADEVLAGAVEEIGNRRTTVPIATTYRPPAPSAEDSSHGARRGWRRVAGIVTTTAAIVTLVAISFRTTHASRGEREPLAAQGQVASVPFAPESSGTDPTEAPPAPAAPTTSPPAPSGAANVTRPVPPKPAATGTPPRSKVSPAKPLPSSPPVDVYDHM